eukprot:gene10406-biopygen4772
MHVKANVVCVRPRPRLAPASPSATATRPFDEATRRRVRRSLLTLILDSTMKKHDSHTWSNRFVLRTSKESNKKQKGVYKNIPASGREIRVYTKQHSGPPESEGVYIKKMTRRGEEVGGGSAAPQAPATYKNEKNRDANKKTERLRRRRRRQNANCDKSGKCSASCAAGGRHSGLKRPFANGRTSQSAGPQGRHGGGGGAPR